MAVTAYWLVLLEANAHTLWLAVWSVKDEISPKETSLSPVSRALSDAARAGAAHPPAAIAPMTRAALRKVPDFMVNCSEGRWLTTR